jgi:hypothetical protein
MTFLLRAGLVIGVIFYLSPVRTVGTGTAPSPSAPRPAAEPAPLSDALLAGILADAVSRPAAAAMPDRWAEAERLWRGLPPAAQQAVLERIRAASGLPPDRPAPSSDPGRAEDRHPPTRTGEPPRRP